jgi:hypothetical protein
VKKDALRSLAVEHEGERGEGVVATSLADDALKSAMSPTWSTASSIPYYLQMSTLGAF